MFRKTPRLILNQSTNTPRRGVFVLLWRGVESVCFGVGSIIIWPIKQMVNNQQEDGPALRQTRRPLADQFAAAINRASTKRSITTLGALSLVIILVFTGANISSLGLAVKGRVLGSATTGLDALTAASSAVEQNNLSTASGKLTKAYQAFTQAQATIANSNIALQGLIAIIPAARDGDTVLQATTLLAKAGVTANETSRLAATVSMSAQGLSSPDGNQTPLHITNNVRSIIADVQHATALLSTVNNKNLPEQYRDQLERVRTALQSLTGQLSSLEHITAIAEQLLQGQHHVLVLLQNNNELRASGGFIGTIGALDLNNGTITKTDIRSVYDYDGQLVQYFRPPSPLVSVNNRLFLRDSNWFTDFPSSAAVTSRFFEREGGETPSLVIALTPDTVAKFLTLTGPLTVGSSTITADNITELLQTQTSLNYDKQNNNPKQLLADAFPVLLQKLGTLKGIQALEVWSAIESSLQEKQLLLTSNNPKLEQHLAALNWNGAIATTDRDYMLISGSNLGGTKTDQFLQKQYDLKTTIGSDGHIQNTISISITNPLPKDSKLTNTSFWRVYVPAGSRLESASGFDAITLPRLDDKRYTEDASIADWNQNTTIDNTSGTFISSESNKTVFGNWLVVAGGESKTATITYTLPFTIKNIDRYSLLWQKQPGSKQEQYRVTLDTSDRHILWHSQTWRGEREAITGALDRDFWYGIVVQQP